MKRKWYNSLSNWLLPLPCLCFFSERSYLYPCISIPSSCLTGPSLCHWSLCLFHIPCLWSSQGYCPSSHDALAMKWLLDLFNSVPSTVASCMSASLPVCVYLVAFIWLPPLISKSLSCRFWPRCSPWPSTSPAAYPALPDVPVCPGRPLCTWADRAFCSPSLFSFGSFRVHTLPPPVLAVRSGKVVLLLYSSVSSSVTQDAVSTSLIGFLWRLQVI